MIYCHQHNLWPTYDYRVDKCGPVVSLLEQGENKGDGGRTQEDQDKLILELLKDELPDGCGWLFGDGCTGE